MAERKEGAGFDEKAALDELEKFRSEIDLHRARRRAVGDEFDQFVRSFRSRYAAEPSANEAPPERATRPSRENQARTELEVDRRSEPSHSHSTPLATGFPKERATSAEPRQTRRGALLGIGVTVLVIVALAVWAPGLMAPAADDAPPDDVAAEAEPLATAAVQPAVPQSAPQAVAPPRALTELRTTAPVWVRVIADGARVVERELPADARIPLTFENTLVIRAGDAGAVHLTLAGEDQGPLGRAGQVVTRTFTKAAGDIRVP